MKNKNILWLYLFLLASIAHLSFLLEGLSSYLFFSKPLILISLIGYFFQISKPIAWTLLSKATMAALIFSLIGDILLLWPHLFIYGLGAFLMAHICYIIAFKIAQRNPGKIGKVNFVKVFLINLPIYIVAALIYFLINSNLGNLKIPVIAYIITIVSMVTLARDRYGKCNKESFWQVFIGACLFLISDGVLAIDMFYMEFPEAGIIIMGTYATAQLLIVMGIRSHLIKPQ
ncbi:lysoplasmalogenase [Algoriphagus sp. NBT04N3]|nr:lysoplasmalogenase [Algoriphagus sp. NBT04N3]QYH40263.1 lysoplasmalogenase [Algoriphagus sp. NBT04N3]